MPVTDVHKDPEHLTLTIIADFAASLPRVWDAYVDPRQIERFWGPPTYPATFTRHDCYVGGRSDYSMTGPKGDTHGGYWEWIDVKPPEGASASFEVRDGFSLPDGAPDPNLPAMRMTFQFEATADGTRMTSTTYFNNVEEMEQILAMGAEEGTRQAMGQIDDVLADLASFAAGEGTTSQVLSDTRVRISRLVRGSVEQVWQAHRDPALLQRWLLGPDGWRMVTCEVAAEVGEEYRYEWEQDDGSNRFGFVGTLVAADPPHRAVQTESMIGTDDPGIEYETTFTAVSEGTLLSHLMTFPSAEVRDRILATGMTDGMEASYQRLERVLA